MLGRKAMAKAMEFIDEYLANGRNGTRAYLKVYPNAKYDTARTLAPKIFANLRVSKYLEKREVELREKYQLTTDDVMRSLSQALHFDPANLYNEDGSFKSIQELDQDTRMALSGITVTEMAGGAKIGGDAGIEHVGIHTKKLKWLDKNAVREQVMKHLGLFSKDKDPPPPAANIIIDVSNMTPEQAYQRMLRGGKRRAASTPDRKG